MSTTIEREGTRPKMDKDNAPEMWHVARWDDLSIALCGIKLAGETVWVETTVGETSPLVECVVCADLERWRR